MKTIEIARDSVITGLIIFVACVVIIIKLMALQNEDHKTLVRAHTIDYLREQNHDLKTKLAKTEELVVICWAERVQDAKDQAQ